MKQLCLDFLVSFQTSCPLHRVLRYCR